MPPIGAPLPPGADTADAGTSSSTVASIPGAERAHWVVGVDHRADSPRLWVELLLEPLRLTREAVVRVRGQRDRRRQPDAYERECSLGQLGDDLHLCDVCKTTLARPLAAAFDVPFLLVDVAELAETTRTEAQLADALADLWATTRGLESLMARALVSSTRWTTSRARAASVRAADARHRAPAVVVHRSRRPRRGSRLGRHGDWGSAVPERALSGHEVHGMPDRGAALPVRTQRRVPRAGRRVLIEPTGPRNVRQNHPPRSGVQAPERPTFGWLSE